VWDSVLFDLVGTLLDYAAAQRGALYDCCLDLGIEIDEDLRSSLLGFLNSDPVQAVEACRPGAPGISDEAVCATFPLSGTVFCPEFLDSYFLALASQFQTIDGAVETLKAVRNTSRIAAVSNGPGPVQRARMEGAGLMQYFDAIVISCEIGTAKPDPAIFEKALRLLSRPKDTAVVIGDGAASDMAGAEAAGIDFVYFRSDGRFAPDGRRIAQITDLREFPGLPGFRSVQAGSDRPAGG